jgi:hypothetical protein
MGAVGLHRALPLRGRMPLRRTDPAHGGTFVPAVGNACGIPVGPHRFSQGRATDFGADAVQRRSGRSRTGQDLPRSRV